MSSYLEKLRARKRLSGEVPKPPEGGNPAEEPTGGTVKTAKNPFGSNGSDPGRRFSEIAHLPSWCRADCRHLRRVALHKLPLLLACERAESPTKWIWSRLDRMSSCPLTTRLEPTPSSLPPPPPPPPTTGPEVTGPVCGGCGSTNYKRVPNGYIFPDGSRSDGWSCGGLDCGVKLLATNRAEDIRRKKMNPMNDTTPSVTRSQLDGIEAMLAPLTKQIVQDTTKTGHPADILNMEDHPHPYPAKG